MDLQTIQLFRRRPAPNDTPPPKPEVDPPIVGSRVELQLLTTLTCNLKCTYCSITEGGVLGSQGHVTYAFEEASSGVTQRARSVRSNERAP